jgi:hypothetical protein
MLKVWESRRGLRRSFPQLRKKLVRTVYVIKTSGRVTYYKRLCLGLLEKIFDLRKAQAGIYSKSDGVQAGSSEKTDGPLNAIWQPKSNHIACANMQIGERLS